MPNKVYGIPMDSREWEAFLEEVKPIAEAYGIPMGSEEFYKILEQIESEELSRSPEGCNDPENLAMRKKHPQNEFEKFLSKLNREEQENMIAYDNQRFLQK